MNVFLAGAAGYVGSRVLDDLLVAGHSVSALAHSERSRASILRKHPEVTVVIGDVGNAEAMQRAMPTGLEAIIYLPGLLREFPGKGITFQSAHVEGTKNLLNAWSGASSPALPANKKQPQPLRWIEMSALGTGPNASTAYYKTKWEAEQHIRSSDTDWTILRPSVIFDDRPSDRKNFVGEIAKIIRVSPFIPILGNGEYRMQPVSVADVSQTIVQCLAKPETIGKTYEIGGPEKLTYKEIVTIIADAMGKRKPSLHIPFVLAETASRVLGGFAFFPFTLDQLTMLKEENIVRDAAREREWRETFVLTGKRFGESVRKAVRVS